MDTAHDAIKSSELRFRSGTQANAARQCRPEGNPTPSSQRELHLRQVYPEIDDPVEAEYYPDIDIIAIHGLDTNSLYTWKWTAPGGHKTGPETDVNWLSDLDMLPKHIGRARIFTCDWPADLLQHSSVPTTLDECAQSLRDSIGQHLKAGARRPIFFIASCLGGIILMKALEIDSQCTEDDTTSLSLTSATRGIIFLATPFRGTAFNKIPGFLLKGLVYLQDEAVSSLIDYALSATPELDELARGFITLTKRHEYNVSMFWEAQNTVLLGRFGLAWVVSRRIWTTWLLAFASTWLLGLFSPWLLVAFFLWLPVFLSCQPQLLVDKHSATLSDFDSQRLDRTHAMMNKFAHSNCIECKRSCMESKDFGLVSSKIVEMLDAIRMRSPLQEADDWIRDQHYTTDRLKIERLSGEALSMDQCYINLAIIEKHRNNSQYAEKGVVTAPNLHRSSLAARQIVETPNKNIQVKLRSLFHRHEGLNGKKMQPRRILIRGRAGVGKTTLCKKMVHSFHTPELRNWNKLFDRVLWLPLRRLKEWPEPPDNLEKLFAKIYFNQTSEKKGTCLAEALCDAVQRGRTLFILDGLDEIEGHWDSGHSMSEFLKDLLNQPNVIITSRPHVSIPASVQAPDVELETIGFYPGQVKKYVRAAFTDAERDYADTQKIEDVKSYLQAHQLVQDLVRIPIQLDALCFTWDKGFSAENVPESMTEIFEAISLKLWRKDIHRLHAKPESECRTMNITRVKKLMREHMDILEALAFSGLYNDILEFDSNHRHQIYNHFSLSVSEFLVERLSFLRTSDPSAGKSYQHYHFLHLTFQEYFAARYFVQQWQNKQPLCCLQLNKREHTEIKTATFLQENKYEPRYDIFWRFVAGLLSVNRDALKFFKAVEEKPRDLLGPMHQYLVMHCLSEVERKDTAFAELRTELEKTLKEWLLVECRLNRRCYLAIEMECPEQVLASALTEASEEEKEILLVGLYRRALIPSSILNLVVSWLENDISTMLKLSIFKSVLSRYNDLPGKMLQSIEPQLDDADQNVQWAAVRALQGQANLTDNMLQRIAALLEAQEQVDRRSRPKILRPLVSFPESLRILATRLEYGDEDVQEAFLGLSQGQVNLTEELLEQVAALLENNEDNVVQSAVLHILKYQDDLTDNLLRCVKKALKSKVWFVRREAVKVFQGRANLTDSLLRRIAALLENDEHVNVRHAAIEVLQSQNKLTDDLLQCVEKALKSEVWFVRGEAVKVFQGRANLTDSLLRRIAALLENDEHVDVRLAAIEVLQEQDKLTDDLLQCVEKALTDKEWLVRHKAVGWFQGRANLTDSLLRRIAALLEDEHSPVRETAFEVLFCQAALSLDSLGKRKSSFFRILLERSFRQHLYCSDGSFIGAGSRHIPLIGRWGDQVSDEILNLRKVWNVPLFKIESTTYVPTTAEASLRGELG